MHIVNPLSKQLFTSIAYAEHLKILIPMWESPQMAPNHGIPCQSTMGSSHAGHCWHGQSNTTSPSPITYASHPAQLPNCSPTNSSKNGENGTIHANHLPVHLDQTSSFRMRLWCRCHTPTMPNNPSPTVYCLHFNSGGNCSRTREDTSNQARAFPHTSQNTH